MRIGFIEMEMHVILADLRAGKSYDEATARYAGLVDPEAIERNREYLTTTAQEQLDALKPPKATIKTKG